MSSIIENITHIINIIISDCNIQSVIFTSNNYKSTQRKLLSYLKLDKYFKCKSINQIYCTICCEHVKQNEYIRKLPCTHHYHKRCIDKWLCTSIKENEDITCPLCRYKIMWY